MKSCLLPLLLLAACTTDPEPQESDRRASEANRNAAATVGAPSREEPSAPAGGTPLIAPALANDGPMAAPGEMRTFRSWVVGCDNRWFCTAVGLGPDQGDFPLMRVVVMRPGGGASPSVVIDSHDKIAPPVSIEVDGKIVASGGIDSAEGVTFRGPAARRLIAALVAGKAGRITVGDFEETVSLDGVSAALRYMDEQQRIAGTNAALVAKGNERPTATPPAAPVVRGVRPSRRAADLSPPQIAAMRRVADCQIAFLPEEQTAPQTYPLGGGATLVLLPCGAGAYNFISAVFVIDAEGALRPARFDAMTSLGPNQDVVPEIINADFKEGVLASFARGRGLGDCGIAQSFVWDGDRFRLIEQKEMNECRGSTRLVRTWQATVRD